MSFFSDAKKFMSDKFGDLPSDVKSNENLDNEEFLNIIPDEEMRKLRDEMFFYSSDGFHDFDSSEPDGIKKVDVSVGDGVIISIPVTRARDIVQQWNKLHPEDGIVPSTEKLPESHNEPYYPNEPDSLLPTGSYVPSDVVPSFPEDVIPDHDMDPGFYVPHEQKPTFAPSDVNPNASPYYHEIPDSLLPTGSYVPSNSLPDEVPNLLPTDSPAPSNSLPDIPNFDPNKLPIYPEPDNLLPIDSPVPSNPLPDIPSGIDPLHPGIDDNAPFVIPDLPSSDEQIPSNTVPSLDEQDPPSSLDELDPKEQYQKGSSKSLGKFCEENGYVLIKGEFYKVPEGTDFSKVFGTQFYTNLDDCIEGNQVPTDYSSPFTKAKRDRWGVELSAELDEHNGVLCPDGSVYQFSNNFEIPSDWEKADVNLKDWEKVECSDMTGYELGDYEDDVSDCFKNEYSLNYSEIYSEKLGSTFGVPNHVSDNVPGFVPSGVKELMTLMSIKKQMDIKKQQGEQHVNLLNNKLNTGFAKNDSTLKEIYVKAIDPNTGRQVDGHFVGNNNYIDEMQVKATDYHTGKELNMYVNNLEQNGKSNQTVDFDDM